MKECTYEILSPRLIHLSFCHHYSEEEPILWPNKVESSDSKIVEFENIQKPSNKCITSIGVNHILARLISFELYLGGILKNLSKLILSTQ